MAKRATILLVEDDPADVESIRRAFGQTDDLFSLLSVPDGKEAIKYLSRQGMYEDRQRFPDPVAVLLELDLPQVDGFQVLHWMRRQTSAKMPPVLAIS